jgi:drug/metabolite transporter (DMT)-like permease
MHALLRRYPARSAAVALALLSLIWGYNWVIMKLALRDAGILDFAALRTVLGALSLFALLAILRRPLGTRHVGPLLLLGLLQTSGFMGLTLWALASGGVGKTAVLVYTMPFWVLLLAWPLLHERIRGVEWVAVTGAFAGLIFLLEPWSLAGSRTSQLLAVVAGVFWAASTLVAKQLRRRIAIDLLSLTAWQMLFGALPLLVLAVALPGPPIHWSGYFIGALVYNVLFGSVAAWLLWLYALNHLPAGTASLGTLATPAVGVLSAALQLGERPDAAEITGMLLVGGALALLSVRATRLHRRVDPTTAQE